MHYLFIESRDPFTDADVGDWANLICRLSNDGNSVSVLYVNDGVMATRYKAKTNIPFTLLASGVSLYADRWSMEERGIPSQFLIEGVQEVGLHIVVDELAAGHQVIWH